MENQYLEAGRIVSTQGLKGETRVEPWSDSPEFLTQFKGFYVGSGGQNYTLAESLRVQKNVVIIKFEGADDIDSAKKLVNHLIYIDRDWVNLTEGTYFERDLIGLEVADAATGRIYGKITEVGRTGANDIYCVKGSGGEVWIPAIKDVIAAVDLKAGKMLITPLRGLFENED